MKKEFTLVLFINKFVNDLLISSLITFIVFQALEKLKTGLISNYFDQNILLTIALSCLIIGVFLNREKESTRNIFNFLFYFFCIIIFILLLFLNLKLLLIWRFILSLGLLMILMIFYFKKS